MTRIAILGATGMLGHKIWQELPARFPDTYAVVRRNHDALRRFGLFEGSRVIDGIDAADFGALSGVLDRLKPAIILNCVGVTKRREPPGDPAPSIALNALLPHRLADWGKRHNARVISFSTDCVFAGKTGGYTEESPTDAEDLYGRTKALGEICTPDALTLRSSFIGRELEHGTELLEWLISQKNRRVHGFRRALYSGISTPRLAQLVGDIIEKFPSLSGLYQIAGPVITKYDLLCIASEAFGLGATVAPDDTNAIDRTLNGAKFSGATGFVAPDWRVMLAELARDPTPYESWRT
jgi:dTDP-4-dehydrorhamnose reductase